MEDLSYSESNEQAKYLGLPTFVGRNKMQMLGYIKDRAWQRIKSWDKKPISRAGKEILLKSVIQALPSYVMNVFVLPKQLCSETERLMNRYWWGNGDSQTCGINWLAWDKMCIPKDKGGVGFRKLHEYNLALVAKQGWRILQNPHSLMARIYKARYFPNASLLNSKLGSNPSFTWSSIYASLNLIKAGARKCIGSGDDSCIWGEPWLLDDSNPYITTPVVEELSNAKISSLRCPHTASWDLDVLRDLFCSRDVNEIQKIPLSILNSIDRWYWRLEKSGIYSVKSGYRFLVGMVSPITVDNTHLNWKMIWNLCVPAKVVNFMWRLYRSCLPTRINLRKRAVNVTSACPICNDMDEDEFHALVQCSHARSVWTSSPIGDISMLTTNQRSWWSYVVSRFIMDDINIAAMLLWSIWQSRNNFVWQGKQESYIQITQRASYLLQQWREANTKVQHGGNVNQSVSNVKWVKPPMGYAKCNIDAAVVEDGKLLVVRCCVMIMVDL